MVGFVNGLAIMIFMAQLPQLIDVPWLVYPLVAVGLAMIFLLPRLTKAVPAPLVSIVVLTVLTVAAGFTVPNVGGEGELPDALPFFGLPDIPLTFETLGIIAPYALGVALVGLMESLMTAKLVDDITDTHSNKTRESWGQGVANIASGFCGGMGGCAMIGQTMINVKSGARTRLSTLLSGVFLLVMVVVLGDIVATIPMAALVAVMIFVAIATFDWHSLRTIHRMPKSETAVMLTTIAGTLFTHNLAIGVGAGVLVACVLFARRVAHLAEVTSVTDPDGGTRVYSVTGALFFASQQRPVHPVRLRRRPGQRGRRPHRRPHLGRLHGCRAGRHHPQVRDAWQERRDRRPERSLRRPLRPAHRTARRGPLMPPTGRCSTRVRSGSPAPSSRTHAVRRRSSDVPPGLVSVRHRSIGAAECLRPTRGYRT
jgi:MFS superfamily sulfate permease-like transporter